MEDEENLNKKPIHSGTTESFKIENDQVIKEKVVYNCFKKNKKILCDLKISKWKNTRENYNRGDDLRLLSVQNKYNVPWDEVLKKYGGGGSTRKSLFGRRLTYADFKREFDAKIFGTNNDEE